MSVFSVAGTASPGNPTNDAGWCGIPYMNLFKFKISNLMQNSTTQHQILSFQIVLPNSHEDALSPVHSPFCPAIPDTNPSTQCIYSRFDFKRSPVESADVYTPWYKRSLVSPVSHRGTLIYPRRVMTRGVFPSMQNIVLQGANSLRYQLQPRVHIHPPDDKLESIVLRSKVAS